MPKTTDDGQPKTSELPDTLLRSNKKAQRTYAKAHDSAAEQYDDEQRAQQVAWDALKHTHEKVGDRWVAKKESGPSDARAAEGQDSDKDTAGGVDANASKDHLYEQAQKLDISGRSSMSKDELIEALEKESNRKTKNQ